MSTIAGQQASPFAFRVRNVLADPGVQIAIAVGGVATAVAGGLLLATSDHLVDPVAFGLQVAIMVIGTVAAALLWIRRRPASRVGPLLLAFALFTATFSLEGASDPLLHSLGVAFEPVFFTLAYLVVFAVPDGG